MYQNSQAPASCRGFCIYPNKASHIARVSRTVLILFLSFCPKRINFSVPLISNALKIAVLSHFIFCGGSVCNKHAENGFFLILFCKKPAFRINHPTLTARASD